MKIREPKIYFGVVIFPVSTGSSGIRWSANPGTGIIMKADTLQGIKQLIKEELKRK